VSAPALAYETAEAALGRLRSGMRVFVGSGCAVPQRLVAALAARAAAVHDVEIMHLLTVGEAPYARPEYLENFRHNAFFIGPNVREAVNEGVADYTPVHLSDIPRLFRRRRLPVDLALVQVGPPDRHGFCSFGVSVDVVKAAVESADLVIAEVNPRMPRTLGDSFVHVSRLAVLVESDLPLLEYRPDPPSPAARRIGELVSDLVEDGATLQTGIGEIPSAVLAALEGKRDLGMHTEMLTEAVIPLIERGVLTGRRKTLLPGKIVTSFCLGTRVLYDYVHDNPLFEFRPTEFTNDPAVVARNARMVAISSALEVDLTGQVCADSIGDRLYSGFGGQLDFIRGAARSEGGRPIIALPSTARDGAVSRIVPRLQPGAGVVTTRADVHYVVTEHGVADLHGKSLRERALALIHVADPRFRDELMQEARARRLVHPRQIPLPRTPAPYPRQYETAVRLAGGPRLFLRPIRPTDEAMLKELFYSHSPQTIFQRYFTALRWLPHERVQRLVTVDYREAMAIVAVERDGERERILAVGRYYREAGGTEAEVAFTVHDEWQGRGLGTLLLRHLVDIGRAEGLTAFTAYVLPDNRAMLAVFRRVSKHLQTKIESGVVHLRFPLAGALGLSEARR
jgi:acyl-CoA hydrolase/RimJ/RimL family protein N-acetyltransferase